MHADHVLALARSTPHSGRRHIFLGDPLGHAGDKTTVEAGNITSPGVWTCGLAVWCEDAAGGVAGPDLLPEAAIAWRLEPPGSHAAWSAGGCAIAHEVRFHRQAGAAAGSDLHRVRASRARRIWLVLRGPGPAGSAIAAPRWEAERGELHAGGAVLVLPQAPASATVGEDAAVFAIDLPDGGEARFHVRHPGAPEPPSDAWERAAAAWAGDLPARIRAPDPRVARGWELCAWHLLAAMERGLPRIGAVNYPGFWMRDGVIILRALDLLGRHDLARAGCDWLAPIDHAGGFGAESDGPGEGAWALARHGAITRDRAWLAANAHHIERRAGIIAAMRTTLVPLRAVAVDRMPQYLWDPRADLLCGAADDGLVRCRMDWHEPAFYGNAWCAAGLRAAAAAASARDDAAASAAWTGQAADLEGRMAQRLLPRYGNERDPACAPWPTAALAGEPRLASALAAWYRGHRIDAAGRRMPEPLWSYFEAAQAHNAMLCGLRDEGWASLSGMLAPDAPGWDVLAFGEGRPAGTEVLPFGSPRQARGWVGQAAGHGNMPHNWTNAEVLAALRDSFVREDGEGLVIGSGVPRGWLTPGAEIAAERMPTDHGPVSFTLRVRDDRTVDADVRGEPGLRWRLDLPPPSNQ